MRMLWLLLVCVLPVLAADVTTDVKLVNSQMVQMWLTDWDSKTEANSPLRLIKNLDIRGAMLDLTVSPENNIFAAERKGTTFGQPANFEFSEKDLHVQLKVTPRPVQPGLIFVSVRAEVSRGDGPSSTVEESMEIANGRSLMVAGGCLNGRAILITPLFR